MSEANEHMPDLSRLPPEIRQKVEQQLARMSPEMRRHFLSNGLPQLLQRLLKQPAGTGTTTHRPPDLKRVRDEALRQIERMRPRGHFNDTVRPGDNPGSGRWLLVLLFVGGVFALLFR